MMNIYRFHFALLLGATLSGLYLPGHAADRRAKDFKEDELALCQTKPCRVVAIHSAGKNEQGEALRVVELDLGKTRKNAENHAMACNDGHKHYWLLGGREKKRLLLDLCNDGYGARGTGVDEVAIGDNVMTHSQSGGSNHQWDHARTVQLSPLTLLNETFKSYEIFLWESSLTETYTDWQKLRSTYTHFFPSCDEEGVMPKGDPEEEDTAKGERTQISLIPRFLEKNGLPKDAAHAVLGTCALETNVGNGFALQGKPEDTEWMRSLIVGDELWISARAGKLRARGDNWLHDDHLELWLANNEGISSDMEYCIPEKTDHKGLRQWGISLGDGKVHAGFGAESREKLPITLISRAELRDSSAPAPIINLRIALPKDYQKLTLVLARGDGSKPISLLATSKLEYGKAATLGHAFDIKHESGGGIECGIVNGRLDFIRSTLRPPFPSD